jgi:hypothetical protein
MNERIRELAEQANILIGKDSYGKFAIIPGHEKDPLNRQGKAESFDALEKFAELIVQECINKCDGNGEYKNHTDTEFGQGVAAGIKISKAQIQTHFGVKE